MINPAIVAVTGKFVVIASDTYVAIRKYIRVDIVRQVAMYRMKRPFWLIVERNLCVSLGLPLKR